MSTFHGQYQIEFAVINTRLNHPSEPSRILQVIPVAGEDLLPKAKMGEIAEGSQHAPLQLTLHGGHYKEQRQKATFLFHCDETASEPTLPSFLWQFNGTHAFSWKSKHACHAPLSTPQPQPTPDPDPPQEPPKDPDSEGSGEVEPPQFYSVTTLFWLVVVLLLIARLLLTLHRRRYRTRGTSAFTSPVPRQLQSLFTRRLSLFSGKERLDGNFSNLYHRAYPGMEDDGAEEAPLTPNSATTPKGGRYGSF
ncbi:hypothetical protein DXG01_012694 [Tephrocybe rancida]|nr:hypothetical protein DXG01_012694 [Tephrocybe rancida]